MKKKRSNQKNNTLPEYARPIQPVLRFSPTAWAKLIFFRDHGETEISGFGISDPEDLLLIVDFQTIKQEAGIASISLDDEAISVFFEDQVDAGRRPEEFFRLWLHTHPGASASPSSTDKNTFARVFGNCDWAIMCILAKEGKTYAKLRFNTGPGGEVIIPVCVDYSIPFVGSEHKAWEAEYQANIQTMTWSHRPMRNDELFLDTDEYTWDESSLPQDVLEQLEDMDPAERQAVLDELAIRPDLWDEESEVLLYE